MHLAHRHLESIRVLLTRHADTGQVPSAEIRVVLAEFEAALDAPPSELAALGEGTSLERGPFGYPPEMKRP